MKMNDFREEAIADHKVDEY